MQCALWQQNIWQGHSDIATADSGPSCGSKLVCCHIYLGVPDHVCFEVGGQHVPVLPAVQELLPALWERSERGIRGPEQREGSVHGVPEQRQQLRVLPGAQRGRSPR